MEMSSGGTTFLSINATSVISPVKMEHRGVDTYKFTGALSWLFANDTGDLVLLPSATINGEDWNPVKGMTIQGSTGNVSMGANLAVSGTLTAGTWGFTNIVASNITSNDTLLVNGIATFNSTVKAKQYEVQANSSAGTASVNFAVAQSLIFTLAAPLTIASIAGLAVGNIGRITVKNTNQGLVFPATVKWPGPSFAPPSFTAGSLKEAIVVLEYDGTNFLANASVY
jgi:hypothetical protein